MPTLIRRRGNPHRDIHGRFCSRRVGQITEVALLAGLTASESYLVEGFILAVNRADMTISEVQRLSQTTILDLCGADEWTAQRVHQRTALRVISNGNITAGSAVNISLIGEATSALRSLQDAMGATTLTSTYRGRLALSDRNAQEILEAPGVLGDVLHYMGLHLHRYQAPRTIDGNRAGYWLETPDGDRFAIREPSMENLFHWYVQNLPSASGIRSWLDDWAYEVDFLQDRLNNLLDGAQYLGIPNYEQGSNRPERELSLYNQDDIVSLEGYVRVWQDQCDRTRDSLQGTRQQGCRCPECRFVNYEITYGEYRTLRNHTDNPGLSVPLSTFNMATGEVRPSARSARWTTRAARAEGYYDDFGNWVTGRRPAAHTRSNILNNRSNYDYDGFLSPENFDNDEDEDEDRGSYNSAAQYGIQAWNYRQELEFFGDGNLFFGFENEINAPYSTAMAVNDIDYIGTTKWDGSVDGGYEIVSQPMSLDYIHSMDLSWMPTLRDEGGRAGRNGLHVHISRAGFASDWHRAKFIKLWMDPANYTEVKAFNRRHNTEYASPYSRLTNYRMARRIAVDEGTRYCMVNVQNRETIEMRGPASTLNRIKLKGTLVGFAASVEYTRVMSMQAVALGGLQWSGFVQWASERPEYAEFMRYLDVLVAEGAAQEVFPVQARELANA